ncbi:MAG TPA: DUF1801 domain-containing protein [Acidimicrobiia bacterium]
MAELKTQKNDDSVDEFLSSIQDDRKREDSRSLVALMERVTGQSPRMWGSSIVGFGDRHYRYASGREGDWFRVGFSPRKQSLTLYVMEYVSDNDPLLDRLGAYTTGKACIYIRRLDDIDLGVLERLVERPYGSDR